MEAGPRKRNFLFLTRSTRSANQSSPVHQSENSISVDAIVKNCEVRKIVNGPTINIDLNEKLEIRLGHLQPNSSCSNESSCDDDTVNRGEINDDEDSSRCTPKRRKLPDLKPISILPVKSEDVQTTKVSVDVDGQKICTQEPSNHQVNGTNAKNSDDSPSTSGNSTKRTKWKCKKCTFQHEAKEKVVLHVRLVHKRLDNDQLNDMGNNTDEHKESKDNIQTQGNVKEMTNGEALVVGETASDSLTPTPIIPRALGSKTYGCTACPYTTGCKSQFINHARFHRPDNGDFKCKHCTYNVTHKHLLLQHVRVHGVFDITSEAADANPHTKFDASHANSILQKANPISKMLSVPRTLPTSVAKKLISGSTKSVINSFHGKLSKCRKPSFILPRPTVKTVLYLCTECPARFFQEKQLKTHGNFHSRKFKIKCSSCTYSTIQREHLSSHMKVHSKTYHLKTQKLLSLYPQAGNISNGHQLNEENQFNNFSLQATNNSLIYCEKCPSKFCSGILYRQHSVYHGKETNNKCNMCNFGTDTTTELAIHKLIHAGSDIEINSGNHWMKFGVSVVNTVQQMPQPGNRAKYYKCNKCPFEFSKRDRYELHLKQHGSNQKYTCPVCDFSVNLYVNYVQHLKKHGSTTSDMLPDNTNGGEGGDLNNKSTPLIHDKLYKCDICPFYAVDDVTVSLHKLQHDNTTDLDKSPQISDDCSVNATVTHKCSYCDFMTSESSILQEHEELHFNQPMDDSDGEKNCPDEMDDNENNSDEV